MGPAGRLYQTSGGASGTTRFLYDGDALVGEYDAAGTMLARYVHGDDGRADEPLVWYAGAGTSSPRYLYADHQGSIVAVADAAGSPMAITGYDDCGIATTGANGATAPFGRFGYTGQAWLPDLGMYHYKARIYSPTLGRFLQTDPIGYDDQINLYAYVANDPVNGTDPTGEQIYRDTHRVGGVGPQHSKIVIVPQDQDSWSRSTVFKSGGTLPDGRVYITIGGGPDRGNAVDRGDLIITPNRPTDLNLSNDVARQELSLPEGVTENAMIGNLLRAQSNYKDNLDYDLFPNAAFNDSNSYNSNGAVTGLLDAVGLDSSQNRGLVGGDKPVPKGCFSKDQGGCSQ